ncbi:MAG: hypothetical protein AMS27_16085 [Bacteroides sp. SM23_62_1]|nr:MAG: hypothetical protein AMS27_16085 [Bacteroides sp. SM23_62_1]
MFQKRFQFDPETIRFVRVRRSPKARILLILLFLSLSSVTAILIYHLTVNLGINPKVTKLSLQNTELIYRYQQLNNRMNDYDGFLEEYQYVDDSIYRCILEQEPLPDYIRQPGLGGSYQYVYLEGFINSELMINTSTRADYLTLRLEMQLKSFDDLASKALEKRDLLNRKPSIQPVALGDPYWLTSVFGSRIDPVTKIYTSHYGLDFAGAVETNIYATGDGIVEYIKISSGGYGKEVVINHGFGYSTRYAHLNKIFVRKGQEIKRGQVVGLLGNSGKSTGPHLHYEVRFMNKPLNPYYFYSDDLTPEEYRKIISLPDRVDN